MLTTNEIIKKYNLITKKSFGQNFLTNPELLNKIVVQCDFIKNNNILEIGTGPCGLTMAILNNNPKKLITVDMDNRCTDIANTELKDYNNLQAINNDGLKINEQELFNNEEFSVISNLPYNIGTTLLFKWLENSDKNNIKQLVLLLQKEVVERIIAKNNTKDYGRVSILCQYLCDVEKCFDIQPTAFIPQPKVVSSVVKLTIKKDINFKIIKDLSNLVQISFSQRRKTLYNNLKNKYNIIDDIVDNNYFFNKNTRAEELTIDNYIELLDLLNNKNKK